MGIPQIIPMIGFRSHRLFVIGKSRKKGKDGSAFWLCRCDCGTVKSVSGVSLRRRATKSCGCLIKETARKTALRVLRYAAITHGQSRTATYSSWLTMRRRCYDKAFRDYETYGKRGITVCDRWVNSFENFLEDMGPRPRGRTLDRIDNSKGYCADNCRWATHRTQMNNTRGNKYLTYGGKTQSMADWVRELGLNYYRVRGRINICKWPTWKALELPEIKDE